MSVTACGGTEVVRQPEIVEVVRHKTVNVPAELLKPCVKRPVPDDLTYGAAMVLWAEDRAALDACDGQISGIGVLSDGSEQPD